MSEQSKTPKFVSPLEKFIKENCQNCKFWYLAKVNTPFQCDPLTEQGRDRMALCMMAQSIQPVNPQDILQEAAAVLADLERKEA